MLVTHDVLDALLLADRVVVLDGGRVVEAGPTTEVLARPRSAFAARIAGLNMVAGTWRDGAVDGTTAASRSGPRDRPGAGAGDPVVAVFRPSAVSVFRRPPGGSPRNSLAVDRDRPGAARRPGAGRASPDHLAADVTAQAAAELDLVPGTQRRLRVKASEVAIYRDLPAGIRRPIESRP